MQIFVSYARDDDAVPPDSRYKGFVSHLHRQLLYEFTRLGQPRPEIWRDTRQIELGDQFEPLIETAISASDVLLVVLSRNWLARPWCRRELEAFAERWKAEGELGIRRRILVAAKHNIDHDKYPPLLGGQTGYKFFDADPDDRLHLEQEFYQFRETQDDRYYGMVGELANDLWRRALNLETGAGSGGEKDRSAAAPTVRAGPPPGAAREARPAPAPSDRVIYLAKPAGDMRPAYDRLVQELRDRKYAVVPDPELDIPRDDSAVRFVDEALAGAELSVHLLGDKAGYAPEDAEPIVKLQLARAALRVPDARPAGTGPILEFRRIVWAPKVVENVTEPAAPVAERDPLAVLAKFDRQLATDRVEGDTLSKFVDFLIQHLGRNAPRSETGALAALSPEDGAAKVYVYHDAQDTRYAIDIAKALQQRNLEPILPAFDGQPAEVQAIHRQNLLDCDAVALCWANASETWMRSRSHELADWRKLGRESGFACRSLVAGPPAGTRKLVYVEIPPRNEIDMVLDLTGSDQPPPTAIDALVRTIRPVKP